MYGTLVVKMASWSVELERLHLDILQFAHGTRMHFSVKICTCRPRTRNYDSKGPLVSHLSHGLRMMSYLTHGLRMMSHLTRQF